MPTKAEKMWGKSAFFFERKQFDFHLKLEVGEGTNNHAKLLALWDLLYFPTLSKGIQKIQCVSYSKVIIN